MTSRDKQCNLIGIPEFQNETSSCRKILATVARHSPEFRGVRLGRDYIHCMQWHSQRGHAGDVPLPQVTVPSLAASV